jgi:hypothetical protein
MQIKNIVKHWNVQLSLKENYFSSEASFFKTQLYWCTGGVA